MGKMYFKADGGDGAGTELWSYDGINAPSRVADIRSGTGSSTPSTLAVFGSKLYFSATNGTSGIELWSFSFSPAKAITDVTIPSQVGATAIVESAHTIKLSMPSGTNVTALVPTITTTGTSVSPASGEARDFTSPQTYTVTAADTTTQEYTVSVTVLAETQTAPDAGGTATSSTATPQVVVINPTQPVTVTVASDTSNPTVDVSAFIATGSGTIPQITINSGLATIVIPATTVTSDPAGSSWDGVLAAPTVTTVTLPVTPGETKTLGTAIEIGFTGAQLSFDSAVRILFPGQKGKRAGYARNDTSFTEIIAVCSGDEGKVSGVALGSDEECKVDVGDDLVIWTRHFTKYVIFTSSPTPSSPSTNSTTSSSSTDSSSSTTTTTAPSVVPVSPPVIAYLGTPESVESTPEEIRLFDIALTVESALLNKANELISRVQFSSFGNVPTLVTLVYSILDSNNKEVYTETSEATIETEQLVTKAFTNLGLGEGKYTLLLSTTYGDNVKDEFRQSFEVQGAATFKKSPSNTWILILVIVSVISGYIAYRWIKRKKKTSKLP